MDDTVRRLALRLKIYNVSGSIMHHVAILKKAVDHTGATSRIVKGYCVIPETNEACEHYWIRVDTGDPDLPLNLDVGFAVAKLRNPELMALNPVLLETLPEGLSRSDKGELLIRAENLRLFELFQSNSKAFWREAPKDVTSFRVN